MPLASGLPERWVSSQHDICLNTLPSCFLNSAHDSWQGRAPTFRLNLWTQIYCVERMYSPALSHTARCLRTCISTLLYAIGFYSSENKYALICLQFGWWTQNANKRRWIGVIFGQDLPRRSPQSSNSFPHLWPDNHWHSSQRHVLIVTHVTTFSFSHICMLITRSKNRLRLEIKDWLYTGNRVLERFI